MNGLLADYRSDTYDEMVDADGAPRAHTKSLYDALQMLSADDLDERAAARARSFRDQGITFSPSGEEWVVPARPRAAADRRRPSGTASRRVSCSGCARSRRSSPTCTARGEVLARRRRAALAAHHARPLLPRRRTASDPPNGVRIHLAGIDLVRDADGVLRVLEDNLRVPSGISYVVENRRTMTRVFPGLFLEQQVRPVAAYPPRLLDALRARRAGRRRRPDRGAAHPRASTTRPTSSTPSSPARWASSWSRAATCSAATTSVYMRTHRRASSGSTWSTGGSTTTSSTRCSSGPTRCVGVPGHPQRGPRRQRHDRQRGRQRRRRRQADLHLRARR